MLEQMCWHLRYICEVATVGNWMIVLQIIWLKKTCIEKGEAPWLKVKEHMASIEIIFSGSWWSTAHEFWADRQLSKQLLYGRHPFPASASPHCQRTIFCTWTLQTGCFCLALTAWFAPISICSLQSRSFQLRPGAGQLAVPLPVVEVLWFLPILMFSMNSSLEARDINIFYYIEAG